MKTFYFSTILILLFACTVMAQTPIAHWPLDGNADEIIDGKHGIEEGGVTWASDPDRGECAKFDGVDGIINLPAQIWKADADTNATITCWFNWAGGNSWQRVFSLGMTDGAWQCMYYCPSDGDGNLHITFKTTVPDQWNDFIGATFSNYGTLETNTWYFTAIVMKEDIVQIWMNNEIILETECIVTPQKIQPDISQNVLGKSHWADPTFNGMIDDFRIYGQALSNDQIIALYNGENSGINNISKSFVINFYGNNGRILYNSIDESNVSKVSVYNLSGKSVFNSNKISDLKTRQFETGIYFVSVINGNEHFTGKVTIVK